MTTPLALSRICQISVHAHDVERATAFYRDVLGMRFLFSGGPTMSFFDADGIRLMVARASEPRFDHPSSILYFEVADLPAAYAALQERGVAFEQAPFLVAPLASTDLWMASFTDSEGNVLALQSEVARPS